METVSENFSLITSSSSELIKSFSKHLLSKFEGITLSIQCLILGFSILIFFFGSKFDDCTLSSIQFGVVFLYLELKQELFENFLASLSNLVAPLLPSSISNLFPPETYYLGLFILSTTLSSVLIALKLHYVFPSFFIGYLLASYLSLFINFKISSEFQIYFVLPALVFLCFLVTFLKFKLITNINSLFIAFTASLLIVILLSLHSNFIKTALNELIELDTLSQLYKNLLIYVLLFGTLLGFYFQPTKATVKQPK